MCEWRLLSALSLPFARFAHLLRPSFDGASPEIPEPVPKTHPPGALGRDAMPRTAAPVR